jgi:hypothetical protein
VLSKEDSVLEGWMDKLEKMKPILSGEEARQMKFDLELARDKFYKSCTN